MGALDAVSDRGPLRTLVVGLGRSGGDLHLPVLRRLRDRGRTEGLLAEGPILVFDPYGPDAGQPDTIAVRSLAQAERLTDPHRTVVHLCTPPTVRADLLDQLGAHGFKRILVEKPLAVDDQTLVEIHEIGNRWDLELVVVAPWLASALTERLEDALLSRSMGALRSMSIIQRKPRFTRSRDGCGHPTAFDVEMPHAMGVALTLAGEGEVSDAALADMNMEDVVLPGMGRAWLSIEHDDGVQTEILSDLTAPTRERRITLEFDQGRLTGHYASSADDHTAQLTAVTAGRRRREILADDALTAFIVGAYERFIDPTARPPVRDVDAEVVRTLSEAKRLCQRRGSARLLSTLCHMARASGHPDVRPRGATSA